MHKLTNPFYKTKRWLMKRANILRRDKYKCRECTRYGRTTPATTVHHIYPLEEYPEYKLTDINLISLCNTCHEHMHDRFNGNQLTDKGFKWMERIKNKIPPPSSL